MMAILAALAARILLDPVLGDSAAFLFFVPAVLVAAAVFTAFLGQDFAFEDATGGKDGLVKRQFASFAAAADEAGISRLYGGIHFRAAIESGLEQGRCIAAHTVALKTRK